MLHQISQKIEITLYSYLNRIMILSISRKTSNLNEFKKRRVIQISGWTEKTDMFNMPSLKIAYTWLSLVRGSQSIEQIPWPLYLLSQNTVIANVFSYSRRKFYLFSFYYFQFFWFSIKSHCLLLIWYGGKCASQGSTTCSRAEYMVGTDLVLSRPTWHLTHRLQIFVLDFLGLI